MLLSLSAYSSCVKHRADSFDPVGPMVATLGNFDGIHIGHQQIINKLVHRAAELGLKSVLICFHPHPSKVVRGQSVDKIFSLRQQVNKLKELGVDFLCFLKFNKKFATLEPEQFVDQFLVNKLKVKELLIGPYAAVGRDRKGDLKWLQDYLPAKNISLTVLPVKFGLPFDSNNSKDSQRVSSNRIREAIKIGDFLAAEILLGHKYAVQGKVGHGKKLGRELGFKTANINLAKRVRPPFGVYAARAKLKGQEYKAVVNYGLRPTVSSASAQILKDIFEVHLIDYAGENFYREILEVVPILKIRDEQKFASLNELKEQIGLDVQRAREILIA